MNSTSIWVLGGYSKSLGTLNSKEHINIETKENKLIELKLPIPLISFGLFPISENKEIFLGGESKNSQKNDKVFIVDLKEKKVKEVNNFSSIKTKATMQHITCRAQKRKKRFNIYIYVYYNNYNKKNF